MPQVIYPRLNSYRTSMVLELITNPKSNGVGDAMCGLVYGFGAIIRGVFFKSGPITNSEGDVVVKGRTNIASESPGWNDVYACVNIRI